MRDAVGLMHAIVVVQRHHSLFTEFYFLTTKLQILVLNVNRLPGEVESGLQRSFWPETFVTNQRAHCLTSSRRS